MAGLLEGVQHCGDPVLHWLVDDGGESPLLRKGAAEAATQLAVAKATIKETMGL